MKKSSKSELLALSGIVLLLVSLFPHNLRLFFFWGGLSLLALDALLVLYRQKILGMIMIAAGAIVVIITLASSDCPDVSEADFHSLWRYGSGGVVILMAGLLVRFLESAQRRRLERVHANCQQTGRSGGQR